METWKLANFLIPKANIVKHSVKEAVHMSSIRIDRFDDGSK